MDLSIPKNNLEAFARVNASTDPEEEVVIGFRGTAYSFIPGERSMPLFDFEGYNIRRCVPVDNGWQLLTREAVFYQPVGKKEILDTWHNPLNDKDVQVIHILNDPVNNVFTTDGRFNFIPYQVMGDDVAFYTDVFLAYPSPLPRAEYPENSQSDLYQGCELFTFFTSMKALDDERLRSVPTLVNWTRVGPWLPWMRMADAPGNVVYSGRGKKLLGGYQELPAHTRAYVEAHHPEYRHAPTEVTGPNETSWTYFRKVAGRIGVARQGGSAGS